jgi:hypothetical protein
MSRRKILAKLYEEYGKPAVDKIAKAISGEPTEKAVRAALKREGYKPLSQNPLAAKLESAAKKPPRRTMTQAPDLRVRGKDDAIKIARKEPHLIQGPDGQYVGGPRGVATPEDIAAMREAFDADVAAGAAGGDWYTRDRLSTEMLAGPDPERQSLFAREKALWSAQSTPDTNLNFALQGHNAYEMGTPLDLVRTGQQARTYREARDAGVPIPLGPKTGIYGQHLDPTVPYATTGTNDIWHARGFGYTNPGGEQFSRALSDQEHRFLDYETMLAVDRANAAKMGGRDNWEAHEIQAAPWVAGKGRGLAQNMAGKGNEPTPEQLEEGMRRAGMTYADFVPKYTANATYEQVPYSASDHLAGVGAGDEAIRARYSSEPSLSWTGNGDRDMLYDALGAYQMPTRSATGAYSPPGGDMEVNRAFVAQPLVGLSGGVVDPASRDMLDLAERLRGYIGAQGASAWHQTSGTMPNKNMGSLFIPGEGPTDLSRLAELGEMGRAYGLPDFIDTGRGVTLTSFSDDAPGGAATARALREGLGEQLQGLTGVEPQRVGVDSSYLPILEKPWDPTTADPRQGVPGSGWATDQLLELADRYPAASGRLESGNIRNRALAQADLDESYAAQGFGATREDIQTARRIFAQDGFEGLRKAREAGIALPGIAAFFSLYGLQDDEGAGGI